MDRHPATGGDADAPAAGAGRLIVLEGGEGVGKTTQWRALAERLRAGGREVVALREPGGTPVGDAVRGLLLDAPDAPHPVTEALLFAAARAEIVRRAVRPALARSALVLLDRYLLSSYVYQGVARGVPLAAVQAVNAVATDGLVPDCTLLLTVDDETARSRRAARGASDRLEREGDAFHARVAAGFAQAAEPAWQAAHPECGPIVPVAASGTPAAVTERLLQVLHEKVPDLGGRAAAAPRPAP